MSFVTTQPEALAAAAGKLQAIGSAMAAQSAAAAAPTTGVVPAAADAVSALQATQFSAYGTLYQQVSAQSAAVNELLVQTLGASAGSYGDTEATNSAAVASSGSLLDQLLALLTGNGSFGLGSSSLANGGVIGAMQVSNFGAAASDLLQLGSSGFLAPGALTAAQGAGAVAPGGAMLVGAAGPAEPAGVGAAPAGPAGVAAAPVVSGVGRASAVVGLSVPPSWAGAPAAASGPAPVTLTGAGWTTAAPQSTPVATMPAGMPSVASAGREGFGFGTPRYGVKPVVMPRAAVV